MNEARLPYDYYPDPDKGRPLFNAYIYFGIPDLDPEIPANQIDVYARQEDGTNVLIPQPVRTGTGGGPIYNGSSIQIFIEEDFYSIKVLDRSGAQVFYQENASALLNSESKTDLVSVVDTWADIATTKVSEAGQIFTLAQHTSGGIGGGTLMAFAGSVTDDGGIQKNSSTPGFYLKRVFDGPKHSDWFGCFQSANQTVALNSFLAQGGDLVIDPHPSPYMIDPTLNPLPGSNFGGLIVPSNTSLEIPKGTVIGSLPTDKLFTCTMRIYNADNITIFGEGRIRGEKDTHIGTTGEHGMGILVLASRNVNIKGVEVDNCWGDAIYIGYAVLSGTHTKCKNVTIESTKQHNSRRQGTSITGCDGFVFSKNIIYNIAGTPPAAGIDLEPDSISYPNTGGVLSDNVIYDCDIGIALFTANSNISGSGNNINVRGPALTVNGSSQVDINISGVFMGGTDGVSPAVSFDGSGFSDMSSVHLTAPSVVIGRGTQGAIFTGAATNYIDIRGVSIKVDVPDVVAISNTGNNYFYDNTITTSGAALSTANKNVIYSTAGTFGNNKFINTTGQVPTYLYLGTTKFIQPEIKLGEDSNTLNDWRSAKPWSPSLSATGAAFSSVTLNANSGATYTKIGDLVFIQGQLRTSALTKGAASGDIVIGNLPFPAVASTGATLDGYGSVCIGQSSTWVKAPLSGVIISGESRIRLYTRVSFAGDSSPVVVADVTEGAGNIIFFSAIYKTTAT